VQIIPETAPDKGFIATIDFIEPVIRKENKTITARVVFDNSTLHIPVGSQIKALIRGNAVSANWLPKDAIISLGLDKIVFLRSAGGFKAHKVETGLVNNNKIEILKGLSATDSVAENAQYLADSESFIKVNN
jgi:Cu(I)/Ag(I) efflux system membrane fusion protein